MFFHSLCLNVDWKKVLFVLEQINCGIFIEIITVEPVLSSHTKIIKQRSKTRGRLAQVKNYWNILKCF